MGKKRLENMNNEFEAPIDDHLDKDEEIVCGYCGRVFSSHEVRVEREIYGRKWVFCNEDCLNNFRDASDFADPEHEPTHRDFDDGREIRVNITGPDAKES